jgi:hypothetical protein
LPSNESIGVVRKLPFLNNSNEITADIQSMKIRIGNQNAGSEEMSRAIEKMNLRRANANQGFDGVGRYGADQINAAVNQVNGIGSRNEPPRPEAPVQRFFGY